MVYSGNTNNEVTRYLASFNEHLENDYNEVSDPTANNFCYRAIIW